MSLVFLFSQTFHFYAGRMMNRFTKDLTSMDENLPAAFIDVVEIFLVMIGVIVIVVLSNLYVVIPSILLILSLWLIRGFYIKTARDVKRIEAISKLIYGKLIHERMRNKSFLTYYHLNFIFNVF